MMLLCPTLGDRSALLVQRHREEEARRAAEDGVASVAGPQEAAAPHGADAQVPAPARAAAHCHCQGITTLSGSCVPAGRLVVLFRCRVSIVYKGYGVPFSRGYHVPSIRGCHRILLRSSWCQKHLKICLSGLLYYIFFVLLLQ